MAYKKFLLAFLCFVSVAQAEPITAQFWPNRIMRTMTSLATANNLADQRAFANIAQSQTDSSIVAATAGLTIRVLALTCVTGSSATTITFNSKPAGAGTAISPLFANGANGVLTLPWNPDGWLETTQGQGLTATTGAGASTGCLVVYVTY